MKTPHNELFYHESLFLSGFHLLKKMQRKKPKIKKIKKRKNKEKKNQALVDFEPLFPDMSWMKLSAFSAIFPIDVHW